MGEVQTESLFVVMGSATAKGPCVVSGVFLATSLKRISPVECCWLALCARSTCHRTQLTINIHQVSGNLRNPCREYCNDITQSATSAAFREEMECRKRGMRASWKEERIAKSPLMEFVQLFRCWVLALEYNRFLRSTTRQFPCRISIDGCDGHPTLQV